MTRDRQDVVEIGMLVKNGSRLLAGEKEDSRFRETAAERCGRRQAQDFISYSIWTNEENRDRPLHSQVQKPITRFDEHVFTPSLVSRANGKSHGRNGVPGCMRIRTEACDLS